MRSKRLTVVGLVMGLIVGVTLGIAGVTFAASSPPTSINTCTKVNKHGVYGAPKVTTASSCSGTKLFQSWVSSKYMQLMRDSAADHPTSSYANIDFSSMALPVAGLAGADFNGANFSRAILADGSLSNNEWNNDDFNGANFSNARLNQGNFAAADFTGANLTDSYDAGSIFYGANFSNANLTGAYFVGATMTSAVYSNTTCPNGSNSTNDGGSCAGQGGGL